MSATNGTSQAMTGEQLARMIADKGISGRELAAALPRLDGGGTGVSPAVVSRLVQGVDPITPARADAIRAAIMQIEKSRANRSRLALLADLLAILSAPTSPQVEVSENDCGQRSSPDPGRDEGELCATKGTPPPS